MLTKLLPNQQHLVLCPTMAELAEMSPEERRIRGEAMAINVFGENCQKDSQGRYVESGIGSPGNTNQNHEFYLAKEKAEKSMNKAILAAAAKKGV
jgi:hypothetical protein